VHIGNKEKAKAEAIASLFTERNCNVLYLNHCTGVKGMMYLRTVLGLKGVNDFYVGSTVSFDV
jgi:7,8-dihydropterin-6-yl-methyl-4-(beta-D-ribofuranosyl)aminobenzene 5'-phosphate synthase